MNDKMEVIMGNNVQIVNTKEPYTYERLQEDLKKLKDKYSFLQIETIGESVQFEYTIKTIELSNN